MTPAQAKDMLARLLAAHGEDIVLKRRVGTGTTFDSVTVRAFVRGWKPDELTAGITQQDSRVILGTAEIAAAGWPTSAGGSAWPRNGDFAVIGGTQRAVMAGTPLRLANEIVRLEMTVKG